MAAYALRRLLALIPVLFGISLLVFVLLRLVPGDPVAMLLGTDATPAEFVRMRHVLGLDRPLPVQYGIFLIQLAQGDLGVSINQHVPVLGLVLSHLPATIELAIVAMAIGLSFGVPLGVLAATRRGSLVDLGSLTVAQLGVALPVFWLAILLIMFFAVDLHWLPTFGRGPSFPDAFAALLSGNVGPLGQTLRHILMPALALGLGATALIMRMVRTGMLEALQQDYVRTARAKGLGERRVRYRHALRNALLPVITVVGLQFGHLLGGAVVTESIFAWPGVGQMAIAAISQRDFPVVQGTVLTLAVLFSTVNLLVDLSYAWVNPKIRYA